MMNRAVLFCLLLTSGAALGGELPLSAEPPQRHGPVTTVCVQVHGPQGSICGPIVEGSKAIQAEAESSRQTEAEASMVAQRMMQRSQIPLMPPAPQPNYVEAVPVYKVQQTFRAAEEMTRPNMPPPPPPPGLVPLFRANEPPPSPHVNCHEHGFHPPPINAAPRFVGIAAPPPLLLHPNPPLAAFPPFTFNPPQMRQAQQFAGQAQQFSSQSQQKQGHQDCADGYHIQQQQKTRAFSAERAFSPQLTGGIIRESQSKAALEKQCEEQEMQILQKNAEINNLQQKLNQANQNKAIIGANKNFEKKEISVKSGMEKIETSQNGSNASYGDTSKREVNASSSTGVQGKSSSISS